MMLVRGLRLFLSSPIQGILACSALLGDDTANSGYDLSTGL